MKILLLVLFALVVSTAIYGCRAQRPKELGYGMSDDDLRALVCGKVCDGSLFPDYTYLDVWLSGNYDPAWWSPRFEEEQKGIDKIRNWAKTTLPWCPLRSEYLGWMDFYQDRLNGARSELKNKKQKKEMEDYYQENENRRKRLASVPNIPSPR